MLKAGYQPSIRVDAQHQREFGRAQYPQVLEGVLALNLSEGMQFSRPDDGVPNRVTHYSPDFLEDTGRFDDSDECAAGCV